jgi:DNA gyrase subunit A
MAGRDLSVLGDENNEDPALEEVIEEPEEETEDLSSANRYRTQRRGGKGVIDIKTTKRNGRVIGIVPVSNLDELMMMTVRGKIQRVAAKDISVIGRNTQGVRIMSLDEGDKLTAIVRVLPEDIDDAAIVAAQVPPTIPDALPGEPTSEEPDSEMGASEADIES